MRRIKKKFEGGTFWTFWSKARQPQLFDTKVLVFQVLTKQITKKGEVNLKQQVDKQQWWRLLAKFCENKNFSVTAGSEQTEVKDVDYYQIVSPVEQVEDKEDGREEVHGNPKQLER